MATQKDLYAVLGVPRTASAEEIRKAYRKLARQHHPDVNPGNRQAEERFKEISFAYDVLGDPEKRRLYDEFGHEGLQPGFDPVRAREYRRWSESGRGFSFRPEEGGFSFGFEMPRGRRRAGAERGFADILNEMFGGAAHAPASGQDIEHPLEIDFLDALRGTQTAVTIRRPAPCAPCGGSGRQGRRVAERRSTGRSLLRGQGAPASPAPARRPRPHRRGAGHDRRGHARRDHHGADADRARAAQDPEGESERAAAAAARPRGARSQGRAARRPLRAPDGAGAAERRRAGARSGGDPRACLPRGPARPPRLLTLRMAQEHEPDLPGPASGEPRSPGALVPADTLQRYLAEIRRIPVLSREEEHALAVRWHEHGDRQAAWRLVTANLRLVVMIAREYQRAVHNLLDLIQEGNVGLLEAVKNFDPYRGIRFPSYAVWWIRAYVIRYIMNNWRLVKVGTTQAQRKLFFNLQKERERLEREGFVASPKL